MKSISGLIVGVLVLALWSKYSYAEKVRGMEGNYQAAPGYSDHDVNSKNISYRKIHGDSFQGKQDYAKYKNHGESTGNGWHGEYLYRNGEGVSETDEDRSGYDENEDDQAYSPPDDDSAIRTGSHFNSYYDYLPGNYVVVPPPRGSIVLTIPSDSRKEVVHGVTYYTDNEIYYIHTPSGYQVVSPPL